MRNDTFLPISDLMSGLMMVFLFISVAFMLDISRQLEKQQETSALMADIAKDVKQQQVNILQQLQLQFDAYIRDWNAQISYIEQQPSIIFTPLPNAFPPLVLFDKNDTYQFHLHPEFKQDVLNCFFPQFIETLYPFRSEIAAINILGHASIGYGDLSADQAYLSNMVLSQKRAYSTLLAAYQSIQKHPSPLFCKSKRISPLSIEKREWAKTVLRANGLADTKQKMEHLDNTMARRVEFQVVNRVTQKFTHIIEQYQRSLK